MLCRVVSLSLNDNVVPKHRSRLLMSAANEISRCFS